MFPAVNSWNRLFIKEIPAGVGSGSVVSRQVKPVFIIMTEAQPQPNMAINNSKFSIRYSAFPFSPLISPFSFLSSDLRTVPCALCPVHSSSIHVPMSKSSGITLKRNYTSLPTALLR
jgi:hypothetical protein